MVDPLTGQDDFPKVSAPDTTYRVIPSRFPPIDAFDTVTQAGDLESAMELEGWTNDRIVSHRLHRLDPSEWVYGRSNASVVMAAFLHGSPSGTRFAGSDLGAWYAAAHVETALIEVLNGLRQEVALSGLEEKTEEYRAYSASLDGMFIDIRGAAPDLHDPDSYMAGQVFGEQVRASGGTGISYDSQRDPGGWNFVCYRPRQVEKVTQASHWRARVGISGKIFVEQLSD